MTVGAKKKSVLNKAKASAKSKTHERKKTQNQSSDATNGEDGDRDAVSLAPDIAFKAFLSARFCSAIWSHITDCDETYNYWEPSHFLLYGKGFQTWEYSPAYGLRSYTYLLMHVLPAFVYASLLQPNRMLIFYFIRCLLGLFCASCETYFYKAVCKKYGNLVGGLVLAFLVFSPGMFISSTAFLPSSFSMYMCLLSTGAWLNGKFELAIYTAALSTFVSWPFYALVAVPIAVDMLLVRNQMKKFVKWSVFSAIVILVPMVAMDSEMYGRFVVAPANIVLYNVFSERGSELYGTEPATFYIVNGFLNFNVAFVVALLAPAIIVLRNCVATASNRPKSAFRSWLSIAPFYMWFVVFTLQPHKEERFLFPVYPLICLCGAVGVASVHVVLVELRFKFRGRPWRRLLPGKSHCATYFAFLATVLLGVSRIFALYRGYHAPMDLYMELNKLHAEGKVPSHAVVNVCVGKEWHRFPNSFFLPSNNWNLRFVRSEFTGQLPAEYDARSESPTSAIHAHFNDVNAEEPSRYFDIDGCHFLVDYDSGRATELEPNYSLQRDKWRVLSSVPFLNANKSHRFFRAFYVPFISDLYCTYSDYNLLVSTKFQLKDGAAAAGG